MDFLSGVVDEVKSWFAESPPEPLVLGAELWCPYGSEHTFLKLERDEIDIDNLPQANVDDCVASTNISPFGECAGGKLCEYKMELEKHWENPEPQTEIVNGKEVITTKSVLICKAEGVEIQAATSGQEYGKKLAEEMNLKAEMDAKYPGLYDLLMNPYGSLYLNEGKYGTAITFLTDRITEEGDIFLPTVFDGNDLKDEMVRLSLGKLMPRCDISTYDRFINGLEDTGLLTGMNEKEGWDVHYLNNEMIEMLRKDCKETDERIKTDPVARWQEENKVFTSSMSDAVTQLAQAVVMYRAMQSQPAEKTTNKSANENLKNNNEIKYENRENKADRIAKNRMQGRAYERQEFAKFSSQNTDAVEQVTIKTKSGVRTRVDAIGIDSNGNVVISEFKSSATAPLTRNQKIAFPEIKKNGGVVVGKGKGIFTGGYSIPKGTQIKIIRP